MLLRVFQIGRRCHLPSPIPTCCSALNSIMAVITVAAVAGCAGLLLALDCLPSDGTVHLYGFNWSPDNWHRHAMQVEQSFIHLIAQLYDGKVVVHPTPCDSLRACS